MNIAKEYKGIYIQDNNKTIKFYEHGAHFSYKALYKRLEQIYKAYNKTKEPYENLFRNLKKANSQKVIRHKSNKSVKISRNAKANHNSIYNKINYNGKLNKSKSIKKLLNFSKSYNEEQFGSIILNKIKNINLKKAKDICHKNNNIKLNENNQTRLNKKSLKNNHTVLKCLIIPKKNINKKENIANDNYYEMSTNKIIDVDGDINGYGDISYNSLYNNCNNKINIDQTDMNNKIQNKNFNHNSKKYEKIRKFSIINKRFVQNLINDSPKNNSTFLSINNSSYYSQNKTQRTSENNNNNLSNYKKKKSCIKKFKSNSTLFNIKYSNKNSSKNKIIENNYYIENTSGNRLYNTNNNKNILLSNNTKQKNKKLTIYNLFNKMNFQNNNTNIINFLNDHNYINDLLLKEKERNNNSNKNSTIKNKKIKQKNNCEIQTKEDKEISIMNYNSSSNSKKKNDKNRKIKKYLSQNNFLKINVKNSVNTPHNKDKNKDSLTFFMGEHCNSSENKKSRNNPKGIVNLLCCHFSININSPINLLNNIQNNITNNNKTQKINTTFGSNNINNYSEINNLNKNKKIENKVLKFDKLKTNINKKMKRKSEEIKERKNIMQKIKKIPIKIAKEKTSKMKSNISNINFTKGNKSCFKKKLDQNISKNRYNSSKRIRETNTTNNRGDITKINEGILKKYIN